jgi:hypothetical protein
MTRLTRAALLATALTLVAAAAASAHPSVFFVTAKTVPDPNNPPATAAGLGDQQQYLVTNHGYTYALRESNGATDKGLLNYKVLPGAYRNQPGFTQARKMSEGDTGAQPHATCRGASALDENAVLAWQTGGDHGNDPFYAYIPWQKTSAGLEDDPASWIPVVQSATGVNLSSLDTPAQFEAACEQPSVGGTYTPADAMQTTAQALNSGTIAQATDPLNAQIATLTEQKSDDDAAAAAAAAAQKAAEQKAASAEAALAQARADLARALLNGERMRVSLDPASFGAADGTTARITGPALQPVGVRMILTKARARRLGLRSRVIGTATGAFGADGTAALKLALNKRARSAMSKLRGPTGVQFSVSSGDRSVTTTGLMSR